MASRASIFLVGLAACSAGVPHFPVRDPMLRDPDLVPVAYPCRPDRKHPGKEICTPETFEDFMYWDLADKSVFRPTAKFFAVRPGGEAVDVNALDEVPDSSWFENRAGVRALTEDEKRGGYCAGQELLPESPEPGSWKVDQGKMDGVTPGFRVNVPGRGKFMLKADRLVTPLRASTAEAVGARLYWAAGFHAPCNFVHSLDPKVLTVEPGITATTADGVKKPFDAKALESVFAQSGRGKDGRVRMGVSQWLPGRALGPFKYDGVKQDDPHDVVPHQDRRELRGGRLMAAWIGHYDVREQNSMATWMASDTAHPDSSPGWVKHWYLDFGDSLGVQTLIDDLSRRYGRAYLFSPGEIFVDFVTFGAIQHPWEKAAWPNKLFPYFSAGDFDPEAWVPGYPNPAFSRMTENDGAWMARIIARIDDDIVAAAVEAADLPAPDALFLRDALIGRRSSILRRYLARVSPLGNVAVEGNALCATDLAARSGLFRGFAYDARWGANESEPGTTLPLERGPAGRVCFALPRHDGRVRVRVRNGQAPGALDAFLLAEGGHWRLLGLRRPPP